MYESRRLVIRAWSRFFMSTSGAIAARSSARDSWGHAAPRRQVMGQEALELGVEAGEQVAFRGAEARPRHVVADVAGRHAERVGHEVRQVGLAAAGGGAGRGG